MMKKSQKPFDPGANGMLKMTEKWIEGYDYYTGENPEVWHENMRKAAWGKGFESSKNLTEKSEKYSLIKINNEDEAESLISKIIEDMGWNVVEENWHQYIGEIMIRSGNKIDGEMVQKSLKKIVLNTETT